MKHIPNLLAIALTAATLSACGHVSTTETLVDPIVTAGENTVLPPQSGMDAQLLYELLIAEMSFNSVDEQGAASYMLGIARSHDNEELYQRATEMALQSQDGTLALEAARGWHEAYPDSSQASQYELQILLALGRVEDSGNALRDLLASLPESEREDFLSAVPILYRNVEDKKGVAKLVEAALEPATRRDASLQAAIWTAVGRMRLAAGDETGALSAAALGHSADRKSYWPAVLALQMFGHRQSNRARTILAEYLHQPDARADLHIGYAQALMDQGEIDEAEAELHFLTQRQATDPSTWLALGLLQADRQDDDKAQASLLRYLQLAQPDHDPEDDDGHDGAEEIQNQHDRAHLALANIAMKQGRHDAARAQLAQIQGDDLYMTVQFRRAQLLATEGQLDAALALLNNAHAEDQSAERQKLLAQGQILRENDRAADALSLLENARRDAPDDADLLYDSSLVAEKLGRLDEAERLLRRIIEQDPDAAYAYNALGYTLADHDLRLDEARELLEKANALSPHSAYIEDSLGWLYYREGQLEQARDALEAAYRRSRDADIAAHLGEVLWKLGDTQAAETIWRESARTNVNSALLRETMGRFGIQP